MEDIFNDFLGDTRFVKAHKYIRECCDIAVTNALKKCFDNVVGPYIDVGKDI